MPSNSIFHHAKGAFNLLVGSAIAVGVAGCASIPSQPMRAERYSIEVRLDPPTHTLTGRAAIDLARIDEGTETLPPDQPVSLEIRLHPDLKITGLRVAGAELRSNKAAPIRESDSEPSEARGDDEDDGFAPRRYRIVLQRSVEAMTLFIEYEGVLFQDVAAGEKAGEIHNFAMRAHIGTEGVYLADGYWYPQPAHKEDEPSLADFTLIVEPTPGIELVASGRRDAALSERTGRLAWRSPYPIDGMVLVGGPHQVHRGKHNDVDISVHLKPSQAQHAEGLIATVKRNLDRYEPLIGKYPAGEFSIVDNFFSSGFAFPCFTLLSSAVIEMGERAQTTHGYIDHEMLHSWWGNGVHVDPRDGNWCEALASYGANYYGHVLDGNEAEARRKRRNYSHFFSRLKPEQDKPLGTYGRPDGCNRQIAYDKGAAVFHMLAHTMGQDRFWAAMRRFTSDFVGGYASWEDIRRVCETESGLNLESFFRQWVRQSGAPQLILEQARYRVADRALTVVLSQGEPAFELDVPIRVAHTGGMLDLVVPIREARHEESILVEVMPNTVELDPDYHVLRRVASDEIIPTTALTRRGTAFAVVLPHGEVNEQYKQLQSAFESSFKADERIELTAGNIEEGALAERCSLILGDAVSDPYVEAFLSAIEFPVSFTEEGFEFEGTNYHDPADAVLCTIHHPGMSGGVTVVFANSDAAIPKAMNVPMYEHSLVIFRNGRPMVRHDFETPKIVSVERS
jgi:hypothetical protein